MKKLFNPLNAFLTALLLLGMLSVNAQTTVQVGTGTNSTQYVPLYAYYNFSYSQTIYTAADITLAGGIQGLISKIRYMRNAGNMGANDAGWTIYMGHTTLNEFANTSSWIPVNQLTQVFSGTITYAATQAWTEVSLTTPFQWNGVDNIVVAVDENASSYNGGSTSSFVSTNSSFYRAIYFYADGTNPDPANPPTSGNYLGRVQGAPNIQFSFLPACSGVQDPGNTLATASSVCSGQSTTLSLQNTLLFSGISYQWQKFDGTNWVDIAGATSTTYTATNLTATADYRCKVSCGTDENYSSLITIVVNPLPTVSVSPLSSITCASEAVTLTASGADTYTWTPNTNLSATTGATVTSTAAAVLTYTVTGTASTGCQNVATTTVTPISAFPITVASTPAVACTDGTPITLNGISPINVSGGGQVEYEWLDSAGTTVLQAWSTNGYTFTPTNIGMYRFNVKARLSTCPGTESPVWPYAISVGFDGDVNVNDVYCGQAGGSINVTNALGPLISGTWYENTFSTANINPTEIQLFGNSATISGGKLILTPNVTSRNGGAIVYNPAGINPKSMELRFDLTVGGGPTNSNGADGMSWSFGPDVVGVPGATGANGINTQNAEHGSGSGLKIGFDAYDANFPNKAGIYLMYNCTTFNKQANTPGVLQYIDDLTWKGATRNVIITIDDLGRLTMKFGTQTIINNIQLPAAYINADKSTWNHAFSARTGGVSMNHEIDNIKITYTKTGVVYGIADAGDPTPTSWQTSNTFNNLAVGSYDVYVASGVNSNTCNKLLGTFAVNDSITPAPGNTITSVGSVCAGANTAVTLSLQDSYSAYTGITYQWQSFDGTNWNDIAGATNATYTFNGLPTTTDFRAEVTCDATFTGASNAAIVVAVPLPVVAVTPTAVTLCAGEQATLTATGADTYAWSPAAGLSATTGASVQANPSVYQVYTVTGTSTATGCVNTASAYVTPIEKLPVVAAPTAAICASGSPVTLQVTSIPNYVAGFGSFQYQWLDSANNIVQAWSLDSSYTFTPTVDGYHLYKVNMRSTACDSVPDTSLVEFYVGFGGDVSVIDINCYIPEGTISVNNAYGQTTGSSAVWYSNDFTSTTLVASQATLHQNASITGGRAVITPSATSNRGGFTVLNPTGIQGTNVEYDITFKLSVDNHIVAFGLNGADGIAYSFAPDANYTNTGSNPCSGFGSKLRVVFDDAGNSDQNGNTVGTYVTYGYGGTTQVGPNDATTLAFTSDITSWHSKTDVPVRIKISASGKLTLTIDNTIIFNQIQLPAEFQNSDKANWKHVFSAQTGGAASRHAIDDLNIKYAALNFGLTATGAGIPSTWQTSPVFDTLNAGVYDVYMSSVNNPSCNKLLGTYTIVDKNPSVNWPLDTVLCAGQSFVLDAANQGSFYQWNTGESGTDEQFYTVSAPGTYIVEVEDTIGCETIGYINVTGSALPVVSLGADASICSGSSLTLDAGTDGDTYLWNNNTTNQTLSVNASGTYSVTVTNNDGCSGSDAITVTVLNAPSVASVTATTNGQSASFAAQTPQNVSTYTWNFGDGNTITTLSSTINYNYAACGTYNVTLTVENNANCGTDNATTSVTFVCAGIEEADANGGLNIYPNPARDFIALANPNGLNVERLSVYDAAGKQLFQSSNVSNLVPDITNWAPGMYIVKIDAEGKTFVQRIIIGR